MPLLSYQCLDAPAKRWQEILPKPGIAPEPARIAPAGMRHRKVFRAIFPPVAHRLRQGRLAILSKVIVLGVASHQQRQLERWKQRPKVRMPKRCAGLNRRQIAASAVPPWIAQSHRDDGDTAFVVKGLSIDRQ